MTKSLKKGLTRGYYNRQTPANDFGGGQIIYLDRHSVYCNAGEILQGYQLIRPTFTTISYVFRCLAHPAVGLADIVKYTPLNDLGAIWEDSNIFLDRHNIACPEGYALQGFRLARGGANLRQIQYIYTCARTAFGGACQTFETSEQWAQEKTGDNRSIAYLDRHLVLVPNGANAMQGFRLLTRYAPERTYLRYSITWCPLQDQVTVRGYVKNATTSRVIPTDVLKSKYAKISFKSSTGAVTDAQILDGGIYEIKLLPGIYTRIGHANGFIESSSSINITGASAESNESNTILLSPELFGWRIVLQWGAQPVDLDGAILMAGNTTPIVDWRVRRNQDGSITLDTDDQDGFGPETITMIDPVTDGVYDYEVRRYTQIPFNLSGAVITLQKDYQQVAVVRAADFPEAGYYKKWTVFRINPADKTFQTINEFKN
jgi:hypothetical protein